MGIAVREAEGPGDGNVLPTASDGLYERVARSTTGAKRTSVVSFCSARTVRITRFSLQMASAECIAETHNIVNKKDGGYDHVYEYVPIGAPNADTIAKITSIAPSEEIGDRKSRSKSRLFTSNCFSFSYRRAHCRY